MLAQGIGHFKREGGWSLMIFCARATRGRGLPSLGLLARPGKSNAKQSEGGRVKNI